MSSLDAILAIPETYTLSVLFGVEESQSPPAAQPLVSREGENLERMYAHFYNALCLPAVPDVVLMRMRAFVSYVCVEAKESEEIQLINNLFIAKVLQSHKVQQLAPIATVSTAAQLFQEPILKKNRLLLMETLKQDDSLPAAQIAEQNPTTFIDMFRLVLEMGELKIIARYLDIAYEKGLCKQLKEQLDFHTIANLGMRLSQFSKQICEISIENGDTLHIHKAFLADMGCIKDKSNQISLKTPYPTTMRQLLEAEIVPSSNVEQPIQEILSVASVLQAWDIQEKYWNLFAERTPKLKKIESKKAHELRSSLAKEIQTPFMREKCVLFLIMGLAKEDPETISLAKKRFGNGFRHELLKKIDKFVHTILNSATIQPLLTFLKPFDKESVSHKAQKTLFSLYWQAAKLPHIEAETRFFAHLKLYGIASLVSKNEERDFLLDLEQFSTTALRLQKSLGWALTGSEACLQFVQNEKSFIKKRVEKEQTAFPSLNTICARQS